MGRGETLSGVSLQGRQFNSRKCAVNCNSLEAVERPSISKTRSEAGEVAVHLLYGQLGRTREP